MNTKTNLFSNTKNDATAGLVVFLIAVPLCLGIALACGAPLIAGINAGIVGGIVIGFLSKSNLSVSGPAAGLTAIVATAITALGSFEVFLCAVMVAGLIQFILGVLKAGSISNYFPSNVIEGMLAAIGVIIILKELPHAVGYDKDNMGDFFFIEASGENTFSAILNSVNFLHPGAIVVALVSLAVLIIWQRPALKKIQWLPGGLAAVLAGVLVNELFRMTGSNWAISAKHMVHLPTPSSFGEYLQQYTLPDFRGFANPHVWQTGLIIAIVASIETLLCIEATDKLDPLKRYTSGNAELRAQGIGNLICGLIGALPVTSVIVRSSANINAGARTKLSTMVHGTLLLVCVAFIPKLLNHIPLASLAAILIITGYRLCNPAVFKHMWKEGGFNQFAPFIITVVAVVLTDLLKGVALGLVVSVFFILRNNMRIPYYYSRSSYTNKDLIKIVLAQEVSFLNKASIKRTLDKLPENSSVIIDASQTEYIDFDVLDIIRDFADSKATAKNINISLEGFKNVYNVPKTASDKDVISSLLDINEVPKRSAGDHKKLLKQLGIE
ncbi:SulP family inorganic anion transporter [Taibaiella soli]|uniref:SulP family inorganic anion transporter n=1 Tax=Taibaiella soli TaxID=1649169 RepID=A0A2W2B6Y3_9BACT|nr:SulP family inorganic anion transporter [Taibaiella soli]PZF71989.1 SulP family inorganic anion transporter [Taibaiella soli]